MWHYFIVILLSDVIWAFGPKVTRPFTYTTHDDLLFTYQNVLETEWNIQMFYKERHTVLTNQTSCDALADLSWKPAFWETPYRTCIDTFKTDYFAMEICKTRKSKQHRNWVLTSYHRRHKTIILYIYQLWD